MLQVASVPHHQCEKHDLRSHPQTELRFRERIQEGDQGAEDRRELRATWPGRSAEHGAVAKVANAPKAHCDAEWGQRPLGSSHEGSASLLRQYHPAAAPRLWHVYSVLQEVLRPGPELPHDRAIPGAVGPARQLLHLAAIQLPL